MPLSRPMQAVAGVLVIGALACSGTPTGSNGDNNNTQVATSLSMPSTPVTLNSVGDVQGYTATAIDAQGNAITDGFTWTSTAVGVATVTGSSNTVSATAAGNGTTTIRVARDGLTAEAMLTVDQQTVGVVVTPGSASLLTTLTLQLSGTARDANGNPVQGVTVTWGTGDGGVATVSGSGLVTAQGVGMTTITASGDGQSGNASITVSTPSLASHVQPILTASCALSGCHAGVSPQEGMNLSAGLMHSNTVNVPSNQSSLDRIEPGLPNQSYLVHKIQGTQGTVGGSGAQMPFGGSPLSQANIDIIRAWIADGAKDN